MADAGRSWYTELDFDSYVLDLLLIGWCTLCFVIIFTVNALVSAFGPLQKQPRERVRGEVEGASLTGAILPLETAKWFNDAVNWFYLHYYYAPEYLDEWVKSLNEQLIKLGGPVQAKFERIQTGSLPPKISHVSCEASPQDRFIIHAKMETRDLSFVVFASQQTHEGVKLTNVTASVLRLKGTLRVESYREGGDVKISFSFEGKPEIKVLVKPLNPYQEASELVDLGVVEANVRNSIILAKTTFTITHMLMPGNLNTVNFGGRGGGQGKDSNSPGANLQPRDIQNLQKQSPTAPRAHAAAPPSGQQKPQEQVEKEVKAEEVLEALTVNHVPSIHSVSVQNEPLKSISVQPISSKLQIQQQQEQLQQQIQQVPHREQQRVRPQSRPEGVFEPVEAQHLHSLLFSAPPKPPRMMGDKRLLVKVIKAGGLTVKEIGAANSVCMVSTDEPIQGYCTSAVKNTQNPFWDEHFLFDITHDTQEVRVEVYDKAKTEDVFIGEAIVYVEDLRKTPSSRQILKLHPEPSNFMDNCGTVTAEFLFMDPSEADLFLDSMATTANNQLSPRRRMQIAQSVTPGDAEVLTSTPKPAQIGHYDISKDGMRPQNIAIIESSPSDEANDPYPLNKTYSQQQPIAMKDKKKGSLGSAILKRFGRKKRAHSADRSLSSTREGDYLRPPETSYGPQSKDDLELVRPKMNNEATSPNLKKTRTLGGSLKKLFKRGQKQSKSRGSSRESSLSRGSRSKDHSRDNSLTRQNEREFEQRASSVS